MAADEVIWHTLIMDSPFKDKIYRFEKDGGNLYFIDWSRRVGSSPHTYTLDDFNLLMGTEEYYLYARKFNENVDMEIINKLFDTFKE